jgi:hypothetical protein
MQVTLTRGKVATIDDGDLPLVSEYRWWARKSLNTWYAFGNKRGNSRERISMHRLIMGAIDGESVDHIDGDGLNNQRENLRRCTQAENMRNTRLRIDNQTGYRGVCYEKRRNLYIASISIDRRRISLGYFPDPINAARAYDQSAREHHGEYASLNFPDSTEPPAKSATWRSNTSGYRGVGWSAACNKWKAYIRINDKLEHLGVFQNIDDAACAYDRRAREAWGADAPCNFPEAVR